MDRIERIMEIVAETCGVDKSEVTLESTVGDFPAWDSIGHMTILSACEEEFGISFEPEEMMEMEDVKDIAETINAKIQ